MAYIITIDSGTSNTRMYLWDAQGSCVDSFRAPVGVRNTATEGSNRLLKTTVREGLNSLLEKNSSSFGDVEMIIAGGMITSNMGLYELPHVTAPAGRAALIRGIKAVLIQEVSPIPIHFVPGVKNPVFPVDEDHFEAMDIMRGEEIETMAVLDSLEKGVPYLLIHPGSHTKFVAVDPDGMITGCLTTLTGELLSCVTEHTILADAVAKSYVSSDTYEKDLVIRGYETAKKVGFGRAAFSARILNQFTAKKPSQIANFLLGAVLCQDLTALAHSAAMTLPKGIRIVVCGNSSIGRALGDILDREGTYGQVRRAEQGEIPLSAAGAYSLAREFLRK